MLYARCEFFTIYILYIYFKVFRVKFFLFRSFKEFSFEIFTFNKVLSLNRNRRFYASRKYNAPYIKKPSPI